MQKALFRFDTASSEAAEAGPASDRRGLRQAPLPTPRSGGALSRCQGDHLPFEWTLNPYRGCEIGCGYCYARYTHAWVPEDTGTAMPDPLDFERRIFWKDDLPRRLGHDLARRVAPGHRIAIGTATDPYQPVERRREITRRCLEMLVRHAHRRAVNGGAPLRISLTTKSDLVVRDLDLLRVLAREASLHVNFSITTLDRSLARTLEPRATTPQRRLMALRDLAGDGIETGVFLMPVLPGLTDGPGMLEAVAEAAKKAGARYLVHQVLFLREPTRSFWFDRLKEHWPALVGRYRRLYRDGAHADPVVQEAVERRVRRLRRRLGLASHAADHAPPDPQLSLPWGGGAV